MADLTQPRSPGRRRQDRFLDLYQLITSDAPIPAMLNQIAAVVCREMRCEKTSVYLAQSSTQELHTVTTVGNVLQMIRVPISPDSLAGYCALARRAFLVADAYADLSHIDARIRFDKSWDEKLRFRTRDVICVPAVFQDSVQGVLQVINNRERPFAEHDLEPLQTLARMIAYLLHNARLYDELKTLKALDKQKAEFIRIMVHELKSPVAGAKMLLDSMPYLPEGDQRRKDMPARIGGRLDQLLGITEDILNLSRVKSGAPLGEIRTMNLAVELRAAAAGFQDQAAAKGLQLHVDIPADNLPVRIDSQGFALIVSNLLSNAIKYTSRGTVSVAARSAGDTAEITVSDTGMGIPQADKEKLFGEFFRASNARESQVPGTGVGLSGVRELVERFYGQISFESEEAKGSAFTVSFPLCAQEQEGQAP